MSGFKSADPSLPSIKEVFQSIEGNFTSNDPVTTILADIYAVGDEWIEADKGTPSNIVHFLLSDALSWSCSFDEGDNGIRPPEGVDSGEHYQHLQKILLNGQGDLISACLPHECTEDLQTVLRKVRTETDSIAVTLLINAILHAGGNLLITVPHLNKLYVFIAEYVLDDRFADTEPPMQIAISKINNDPSVDVDAEIAISYLFEEITEYLQNN